LDALPGRTGGQKLAYHQLQEIAAASGGDFEVVSIGTGDPENLVVEISLDVGNPEHAPGGLRLRPREKFNLVIYPQFPYGVPGIYVPHQRFAGFAHVYWGTTLCLYQAPESEYDPSQGMFAFIHRLLVWLKEASLNNLDPPLQPLHPPQAVPNYKLPLRLVVQADAPPFEGDYWLGFARLERITDTRLDVVGWMTFDEVIAADYKALTLFPAFLSTGTMPHQFPKKAVEIIDHFTRLGLPRDRVLGILRCGGLVTPADKDFCLIFGCAMRGPVDARRQHLTAWYFDATTAKAFRIAVASEGDDARLTEIRDEMRKAIDDWLGETSAIWCPIMENRKEIIVSRQDRTPAEAFKGLRVAVWGSGALGTHVATFLAQSDVARLHLVDNGLVKPGILGRQLFDDLDIGKWKAEALAERMRKMRPRLEITFDATNLIKALDDLPSCFGDYDVVIDCTASRSVQLKLEKALLMYGKARPTMASMVIDARAERGLMLFAPKGAIGALREASFRAQLEILETPALRPYADAFFPEKAPEMIQPEPGCSEPTFRGSGADCAALTGSMHNMLGKMLQSGQNQSSFVVVTQPGVGDVSTPSSAYTPGPAMVLARAFKGFESRMFDGARQVILDHLREHKRRRKTHLETGGLLFGQMDEAAGVAWISHATPPPPDSVERRDRFICGTKGTARIASNLKAKYRSNVVFLGMWHTHPDCQAFPSHVDFGGAAQIMTAREAPRTCFLLILSLMRGRSTLGTYSFSRVDFSKRILQMDGDLVDFPLA
jgi:integrative and conjugative element protein (TIGR02256 family)